MNSPQAVKMRRVLFGRVFLTIGGVGLTITIAMNLAALVIFKRASAEFFSDAWWSAWFASYLVWLSFLAVGLTGVLMKKEPDQPSAPPPAVHRSVQHKS